MIICSCNALTEAQILASLKVEGAARPRSAGQAYRCLGCAPRCGRCIQTVRAMVARAHLDNCTVGCAGCPRDDAFAGERYTSASEENQSAEQPFLIAAE